MSVNQPPAATLRDGYVVRWKTKAGTEVTTTYATDTLFGPAREDESITWIEWLLRSLRRDGFEHLTLSPYPAVTYDES